MAGESAARLAAGFLRERVMGRATERAWVASWGEVFARPEELAAEALVLRDELRWAGAARCLVRDLVEGG